MMRPAFPTIEAYGRTFTNAAFWRPYVEYVWSFIRIGTVHDCKAGLPGTHPVFVVNDTYIIKFFTNLFGVASNQVELAFYQQVAPHLPVSIPSLVTHGALFPAEPDGPWHWPYIITTRLQGVSIGEAHLQTPEFPAEAARYAAGVLQAFHNAPLHSDSSILDASWQGFAALLSERRQAIRPAIEQLAIAPTLRSELLARLDTMPTPYDTSKTPRLLHGDLNRDHILGVVREGGSFAFTGVIDFGDVKVGDPLYDLVPLHFGLFATDKTLLRVFLDTYGGVAELGSDFAQRAMDYTLLYESVVLTDWLDNNPEGRAIANLAALQDRLWRI